MRVSRLLRLAGKKSLEDFLHRVKDRLDISQIKLIWEEGVKAGETSRKDPSRSKHHSEYARKVIQTLSDKKLGDEAFTEAYKHGSGHYDQKPEYFQ